MSKKIFFITVTCSFLLFSHPQIFFAQEQEQNQDEEFTTVASPVEVEGDVRDHDIISYSPEYNQYTSSRAFSDETMFGVIIDDPVLYMDSENMRSDKTRPVVRYGEVLVNVSTLGGEIISGDLITTSPIPGFGQKTFRQDASYILGFALEPMTPTGQVAEVNGKEVQLGTVPVTLRIGPFLTKKGADFVASGGQGFESLLNEIKNSVSEVANASTESQEVHAFKVFRYFLAAVIAISSIVVSVSRFGDAFKEGVVSIGRNPLARSQIRSMLAWNVFLIVLVSGAGLGVAVAIVLLP